VRHRDRPVNDQRSQGDQSQRDRRRTLPPSHQKKADEGGQEQPFVTRHDQEGHEHREPRRRECPRPLPCARQIPRGGCDDGDREQKVQAVLQRYEDESREPRINDERDEPKEDRQGGKTVRPQTPIGHAQQGAGEKQVPRERGDLARPCDAVGGCQDQGPEQRRRRGGEFVSRDAPDTVQREILRHRHRDVGVVQGIDEMPLRTAPGERQEGRDAQPKESDSRHQRPVAHDHTPDQWTSPTSW
jgi:hypothetical protein